MKYLKYAKKFFKDFLLIENKQQNNKYVLNVIKKRNGNFFFIFKYN